MNLFYCITTKANQISSTIGRSWISICREFFAINATRTGYGTHGSHLNKFFYFFVRKFCSDFASFSGMQKFCSDFICFHSLHETWQATIFGCLKELHGPNSHRIFANLTNLPANENGMSVGNVCWIRQEMLLGNVGC